MNGFLLNVIGGSGMLLGRDVSRNKSVKMRSHTGAAADYFIVYVQPTVCKKPVLIINNTGSDDFKNNIKPIQKLRKVIATIKEYDTDDHVEIALCSIVY